MSDSALAEPGILLRMVVPEPPNCDTRRPTTPGLADGRGGWLRTALVACGCTWAVAWFALAAALDRVGAVQLDVPRPIDWLPSVLLAVIGVACGLAHRDGRVVACTAVLLLGGGAVAGLVGGDAVRLGQHAFGLFLVLGVHGSRAARQAVAGAAPWSARVAIVVGLVAGTGAVLVWPVWLELAGAAGGAAGSLVAALLVATFAAMVPGCDTPPSEGWQQFPAPWWKVSFGCLLVALLWWGAPASWWRGVSGWDRVLYLGLASGSVWAFVAGRAAVAVVLGFVAVVAGGLVANASTGVDLVRHRLLGAHGTTVAVYDRSTQGMQLFADGQLVDAAGGERVGAELATTVLRCLVRPGDRVLVLGQGAGRLPSLLVRAGLHEVEVVDGRPGAAGLQLALSLDGPVEPASSLAPPPGVRRRAGGWLATLQALPDDCRQVIVLGEAPSAATFAQATIEVQVELRRIVGAGLVLQSVALDRTPAERVRGLLAAAAAVHPWNAVFAVGDDAWLLSAAAPPQWPASDAVSRWPADARWIAHAAHLGEVADAQRALLGTVDPGSAATASPATTSPPSGRKATSAVLLAMLRPVPAPPPGSAGSVLLRWISRGLDQRAAEAAIRGLGGDPADLTRAQAIAAGFLHVGAPSACLQAALGLPAADGVTLVAPAAAALRAHAVDPLFFDSLPPVLQSLPRPRVSDGDLEDLARLPDDARLAELCAGDAPLGVALRVRFASRCARALLAALAAAPLPPQQVQALRELADPFVLAEAGAVLSRRSALPELLALWRGDLPMPTELGALRRGPLDQRRLLGVALGGRQDAVSLELLADFLVAPEVELRRVAGASLQVSVGDRVPYDPEWSRSALNEAADRLRSLHNRHP